MKRVLMTTLCLLAFVAIGFPLNPSFAPEAVKEYKARADAGDAEAQYLYSCALGAGRGVVKDLPQAFVYAEKAVGQGCERALGFVGRGYEHGWGVETNAVKATECYSRFMAWAAKAAEEGDVDAQLSVGMCYYVGIGVETNMEVAVKWFRKAAEQEYASAQYALGFCYMYGQGVDTNKSEAVKWYRRAAERGWTEAQVDLGVSYVNGTGVEQDLVEAVKWFRKAAEQEDAVAQAILGMTYENGKGVETNRTEAVKWYRKAAEQSFAGSALAQNQLGRCYEYGKGVEANKAEAVKWYRKAAEQGDRGAQQHIDEIQEAETRAGEIFQIVRADSNPTKKSHKKSQLSWKLLSIGDALNVKSTQIRKRLKLICDPEDKISGRIASVKPLTGGEKGFLVTVDDVSGEGKMGLSYDGILPVYYDVKVIPIWLVPVASCRTAMRGRYDSRVFITGVERGLAEGEVISPSVGKCGYRVLSISDRCVWFEAFYDDEPPKDKLPHVTWPDFSRIDTMPPAPPPGRLMLGKRAFWPGDVIKLPISGFYLMVDDFLEGKGIVFRLLDSSIRPVTELLCVIVREEK